MFKELEISSLGLFFVFFVLVLIVIGTIIYFRNKFKSYSAEQLIALNQDKTANSLSTRSKYPEVNTFQNTGSFFNFGLAASFLIALATMSWTTYENKIYIPDDALLLDEEVEVEIPRTAEPPPPPPPPPPPVIEEVPDTEIIEEEQPKFESMDVDVDTKIDAPVVDNKPPPPPPPPPPPKKAEVEEVVKFAEQMPRFPGCEDKGTNKDKEDCAKQKMLEYIYSKLKYPVIAKENGVEGQVVIQFVVGKDGSIQDTKIVRDIGAGCGDAAKLTVESMNDLPQKWTPGKQGGRPVKVLYTLPVKFKLEG